MNAPLPMEALARDPAFEDALAQLRELLGPAGCLEDAADIAPHLGEWRGLYFGRTAMVARPADTAQVAAVMKICSAARLAVIPQGGNTGMCGAGVPPEDGRSIVLSLARMRRVREVDAGNYAITVEAGCILADIQQAAAEVDRLFPLSLGAEGSCQIGGNLSTNAGGIQVLRYGNMRELTLGLEVVLPDGQVIDGLRALRKDNTGYDLKQLFVGAEGTLGVITAATLRLFPRPRATATAYVSLGKLEDVIALLTLARRETADQLTAFEFMPRFGIDIATRHVVDTRDPLPGDAPWYVLLETSTPADDEPGLTARMEAMLGLAVEQGLVLDAVLASSQAQRLGLWRIREAIVEAQKFEGASLKYDVSVPVTAIPRFAERAVAACLAIDPTCRPLVFGHCGDGNVHFNVTAPVGDDGRFKALGPRIETAVFDCVRDHRGSISAEHGIGRTKRAALGIYKSAAEIDLMRRIKAAIDPLHIMNPDKVLPAAPDTTR